MLFLVTGGCGFLGAHIVRQLLKDTSAEVAVVSRKLGTHYGNPRLSYHSADITSQAEIQAIFDELQPDAVIHTASPHHTEPAQVLYRTNVEGTKVLLDLATACPETCAFVYTSSDSAVVPTQEPLSEDKAQLYDQTRFNTPYGLSKAIADKMVQEANSDQLHTAVIRLPVIYGRYDNNLIPQLVSSIRKKEHKMQVGDNSKVFEFVYVNKAAEAHILAAHRLLDPKYRDAVAGEAFFISDGRPEPFFTFARRCYAAAGHPVAPEDVTVIPLALMQAVASVGEWAYKIFTFGTMMPKLRRDSIDHLARGCCWYIEKAKNRLGYQPVTDQDEAIRTTMEWAMETL